MLDPKFYLLLDKLTEIFDYISRESLEIILYRLDGIMYHRSIDNLLVRALIAGMPYSEEIWDVPAEVVYNPEIDAKYYAILRRIVKVCDKFKEEKIDFTKTAIYLNCAKARTPRLW